MLVIGARLFPWLIVQVAHTKSRELLSLGTLALALGVAWAAYAWFDASFALGAFLAGLRSTARVPPQGGRGFAAAA